MRAQLMVQIVDRVKKKRRDRIFPGEAFMLLIVRPTPAPNHDERAKLHIIAEVNKPPLLRTRPALFSFQQ